MSETYPILTGFYGTPFRRVEPTFLQPRRFPEYLRLQNLAERRVDIAELSSGGLVRGVDAGSVGSGDETLAKIGDVLPVEPGAGAQPSASKPTGQVSMVRGIDGLGRMIDVLG